MLDAGIAKLA
jgi:hypothetical protein